MITDNERYGYGLFETVRYQDQKPQFLLEHFIRLQNSAIKLNLPFYLDFAGFKNQITQEIKSTTLKNGVIRSQLSKINQIKSKLTFEIRKNYYNLESYHKGFAINISSYIKSSKSIINFHKTSNYLENLLQLEVSKKQGFNEVVFFNEKNFLTEGSFTNIFLVNDNKIMTPALNNGLLNGIIRQKVLQYGFDVKQDYLTIKQLINADEIFLTNSIIGIMPVCNVGQVTLANKNYIITKQIKNIIMKNWRIDE